MKISGLLLIFLIAPLCFLHAQIQVLDTEEYEISASHIRTAYEMRAAKLTDGRIKIAFRNQGGAEGDFGEIFLQSEEDFENLYHIINTGFDEAPKTPIKLDLGNSILQLYYSPVAWGKASLVLSHAYKSSPYLMKKTNILWQKDIRKLFNKS